MLNQKAVLVLDKPLIDTATNSTAIPNIHYLRSASMWRGDIQVDRVDVSERFLAKFDTIMNILGGSPIDVLRLADAEVVALTARRGEDPDRIDELVRRFDALAQRHRYQIN